MRQTVKLNGKAVVIDTDRPAVAKALVALVEACAVRQFKIGTILEHHNGDEYILASIKRNKSAQGRAYLVNTSTGRARNSSKVVMVQGNPPDGYFVEDLPCEKDKFYDPEGNGEFLDI